MRSRWVLLAGCCLIAGALVWWGVDVTLLDTTDQVNASTHGQFILAIVGVLISVTSGVLKVFAAKPEPSLDNLADLLETAMRARIEKIVVERRLVQPTPLPIRWQRATDAVAGPTPRDGPFAPLPGLARITASKLRSGNLRDLHAIYGGLPSGRMLIVGDPGTGKSSTAVLLLRDALSYRRQSTNPERIPVPVMFTLYGWHPDVPLVEWLTVKLAEIPMFRGREGARRARALLADGRIAVFLDGLDEIAEADRADVLRVLADQATFRLVLLTRLDELAKAAQQHTLTGAVALHLQPPSPHAVAEYVLRPLVTPAPEAWRSLADAIERNRHSAVAKALANPFLVSLLHDIYGPSGALDADVTELLDEERFPSPESVHEHLLDLAMTAAYTNRRGRPESRYRPEEARRALAVIARRMAGSRDLVWWQVPMWMPFPVRVLSPSVVLTVLMLPFYALCGLSTRVLVPDAHPLITVDPRLLVPTTLAVIQFAMTAVVRIVAETSYVVPRFRRWLKFLPVDAPTPPTHRGNRGRMVSWASLTAAGSAFAGAAIGDFGLLTLLGAPTPVVPSLLFGLATGLVLGLVSSWMNPGAETVRVISPIDSWRSAWMNTLGSVVVMAVICGVPAGAAFGLLTNARTGVFVGIIVGVIVNTLFVSGLVFQVFRTLTAQIHLSIHDGIPLRLFRFLEDAHSRHILRTVGPVYQFRHATLQDHLTRQPPVGRAAATRSPDSGPSPSASRPDVPGRTPTGPPPQVGTTPP